MGIPYFVAQSSWTETGRVGLTVLSLLGNLALAGLVAYTLARSKTADILRGEKDAWKEKAERLDDELKGCKTQIGVRDIELAELRTKTDLKPLLEKLEMMYQHSILFEKQSAEVHAAIVVGIQANTTTVAGLGQQFQKHSEADQKIMGELAETLRLLNEKQAGK